MAGSKIETAQAGLASGDMDRRADPAPVSGAERLDGLDIIRGIAVLGILLANIVGFAHVDLAYYWPPALPGGVQPGDGMMWLAQFVLVDGKLRALFTILFGAGMVLFTDRIRPAERAIWLQGRRLAWLLLFGLLHFFLLFRGDILFSYACAGFFALFALSMSVERLLALGIVWAVIGGAMQALTYLTPALVEGGSFSGDGVSEAMAVYREFWAGQMADAAQQGQVMAGGSLLDVLRYRLVEESSALVSYFSFCFFETIPYMLIGMGLYRSGLFAGGGMAARWRWLAWGGVVAGIGGNLLAGLNVLDAGFPPFRTQLVFFGISPLANVPLVLGATCLLAQWAARPHGGWLVERLRLAGRMAFTNYIGTSLVMVLLFQGWAGGLFGTLHRAELLLVVLLGWALMLTGSRMWLAKFRYGPLEWLWRCLTYWHRFPIRRVD